LFDAARVEKGSLEIDEGSLSNRRTTLQSKIEMFHSNIQSILGDLHWDGIDTYVNPLGDRMEEREEEEFIYRPELSRLWMPSSFGKEQCLKNGWEVLVEEELRL
jgi:hypothetical protein